MNWKHKDEWKLFGKNYLVAITRHTESAFAGDGEHRWCVYAYIYPKHPHFSNFSGADMWQDSATCLPLHGGPTYLEYPMYNGEVTSVKVGCDYNHLHDTYFTHCATKEEAYEVFEDAEILYNFLKRLKDE